MSSKKNTTRETVSLVLQTTVGNIGTTEFQDMVCSAYPQSNELTRGPPA
jgi:hypothetical protein